ncbi:uncharacterized protein M6B38_187465 [Iris pallida]|uniref:Uncharacterized protein n=1 Tax=Iris pallida TaxID=29817 RepID=A0AAX6EIR7_IRIPA|nr:uncharacterized protein M6B38_187465 [Iris pallida]
MAEKQSPFPLSPFSLSLSFPFNFFPTTTKAKPTAAHPISFKPDPPFSTQQLHGMAMADLRPWPSPGRRPPPLQHQTTTTTTTLHLHHHQTELPSPPLRAQPRHHHVRRGPPPCMAVHGRALADEVGCAAPVRALPQQRQPAAAVRLRARTRAGMHAVAGDVADVADMAMAPPRPTSSGNPPWVRLSTSSATYRRFVRFARRPVVTRAK